MKYGLDFGHGCHPDIGAMNGFEDELNKELGTKVAAGLISIGHDVVICNPKSKCSSVNQSLRERCQIANKENVDRFISFHFNAFNTVAFGAEVYYISNAGHNIAKPVLKEICDLKINGCSLFNRGCKRTTLFQVLNGTIAPAILIETAFCDNPNDMRTYNQISSNRVATAIVKGLTGNLPTSDQPCLYIN